MAEIFVGSVSVGVVPDARDFNKKIREQLFPDADNVGREYGEKLGRGIQEAVRISVERIKEELRTSDFQVNVGADTTKARDEIDAARIEEEARPVKLRVHADESSLRMFGATLAARVRTAGMNLAAGGLAGLGGAALGSGGLALAGPLGAAGLGIAGFAALAVPELTKVHAALTKIGPAGQKAWQQLTPGEKDVGRSLKSLEQAFKDVQKSLQPVIDNVVKFGVGIAKDLLPVLRIFASVGAAILQSFFKPFDAWVNSSTFKRLTDQFAQFGETAGRILGPQLVQLVKVFSNLFVQLLPVGIRLLRILLPTIVDILTAMTPGIVVLAALFTNTLQWLRATHLLIPIIVAATAALVIFMGASGLAGIIAAIILVTITVGFFAKHWRQVWTDVKNWAQDAWRFLTNGWGQWLIPGLTLIRKTVEFVRDHWRQAWNDIKDVAVTVWHFIYNNIVQPWENVFTKTIPNAVSTAVRIIGRVWGTIKDIFRAPVSFLVNTVYDNGIARLWNDVMGAIHGPKLPLVHFARGGRVGGYGGGDIVPALLEPGETVVSKEHSSALASIFRAAGVPGYQQGGLAGARGSLSDIQRASHQSGGWLGSLFSGIGDAGKIMLALMTGNSTAAVNAFSSLFHTPAAGELATMMLGIPRTIVSDAVHSVIHLFSSLGGVITGGHAGAIGGGVQRYAGTVAQVLRMLGQPAGDIGVVLSQMTTESGGNPVIVNKWDSNWAAGTPSVGLMQVIGPTFRAYAGPFAGLGPFEYGVSVNPLANIFAGINYAIHRYGAGWTSVLGHGHGYDQGGWLYPGEIALSKLTKPEAILSPSQWEAIYSAAQRGGDGDQYHMHFDGMSYKAFSAEVGHAMRVVDVHKGLSQRSGRRV